jgi:hypothetical protein
MFVDLRRSCLVSGSADICPWTEDDGENEDAAGDLSDFLSAPTPQQKALPVVLCELSQICAYLAYGGT